MYMDWMGEIPNGSCTALEIRLKHSEQKTHIISDVYWEWK